MLRVAIATVWVALTVSAAPVLADEAEHQSLFFIQRSKNANEVHYDALVRQDGALDPKKAVVGYWINKATDGSLESLSLLQRLAYGYSAKPDAGAATWTLTLRAFPSRPLTLVLVDGRWRARIIVGGRPAYLQRLYAASRETLGLPRVLFVDLFGEAVDDGAEVTERLTKR